MRYLTLIVAFYFIATCASAQEMWGISNSNYSGNMGIQLNPSTIVGAPYKYEYHYFSMDLYAQNSYVYLPAKANVIINGITGKLGGEKNFFDLYEGTYQYGFGHVNIIGPSYINSDSRTKAWGIHTGIRNEFSAINVPSELAKYIYERYDYKPFLNQHYSSSPFSVAYMSWAEIGGTYGKAVIETNDNYLKVAATGNLLLGFDAMYLDAGNIDYNVIDSSSVIIHSMDATIGHALDVNGNTGAGNFLKIRGFGISTTLGATYIHGRSRGAYECGDVADQRKKYDYRIGVSLMDFGLIGYSNQAQILQMHVAQNRQWSRLDSIRFHSFSHLDETLSNNVNGTASSVQDQSFAMFLPSAVSLQFDYSFTAHLYGNVSVVNRVYYSPKEIARGNQLSASFRFEKRKVETTAGFSLFEYKQPAFGIAFRFSGFIIGTDRLLEWLSVTDIKSFDLFFGFRKSICGSKTKTKTFCPSFN